MLLDGNEPDVKRAMMAEMLDGATALPDALRERIEAWIGLGTPQTVSVQDGDTIDLGGRILRIIATPGHTPGSLCLLDEAERRLFTGDTCLNCNHLLNLPNSCPLPVFLASLRRLAAFRDRFDMLHPGHMLSPLPASKLDELLEAVEGILTGTVQGVEEDNPFGGPSLRHTFGSNLNGEQNTLLLPTPDRLRLMTFNIRNIHGDDGTPDAWPERRDNATRTIESALPDVMGLQEAFLEQTNWFLERLPVPYASIGRSRFGNDQEEHSNILYRTDRFDVQGWGQFWLSATPEVPGSLHPLDPNWPRICTWARFSWKNNPARQFWFFNTHFGLTEAVRTASAALLLERQNALTAGSPHPVFLAGDFNCVPGSPALALLRAAGLADTWEEAGLPFGQDGTYHAFKGDRTGEHIDFVFRRGTGKLVSLEVNHRSERGRYPSDHFPLQVVMDMR